MQVVYPDSFAGEWQVSATLANVTFPLGMTYITKDTPGATKSSMIAALPDVGAGMDGAVQYRARFSSVPGGAVPDRCDPLILHGASGMPHVCSCTTHTSHALPLHLLWSPLAVIVNTDATCGIGHAVAVTCSTRFFHVALHRAPMSPRSAPRRWILSIASDCSLLA